MIRCEGVSKRHGGRAILDGFSFESPAGAVTAVLGPSGCGKTTLLRCLAGLDRPDAGRIDLAGLQVFWEPIPQSGIRDSESGIVSVDVPPERRGVNLVFQDLALWPHMTAAEQVAFALEGRGGAKAARREAARGALAAVGLPAEAFDRRPEALSGGERQRLALARAMAPDPAVLLLDEPFAGLHPKVRAELAALARRFARGGWTGVLRDGGGDGERAVLLVTHLAGEALASADRVAILEAGRCGQAGSPETVFSRPATPEAALLLGYTDCLAGTAGPGEGRVATAIGAVECAAAAGRGNCTLAFRPGDFVAAEGGRFEGVVAGAALLDGAPALRVRCGGAAVWVMDAARRVPGETVRFDQARPPAVVGG